MLRRIQSRWQLLVTIVLFAATAVTSGRIGFVLVILSIVYMTTISLFFWKKFSILTRITLVFLTGVCFLSLCLTIWAAIKMGELYSLLYK
jgi:hypothetical protein